jgi:hypothetical protein
MVFIDYTKLRVLSLFWKEMKVAEIVGCLVLEDEILAIMNIALVNNVVVLLDPPNQHSYSIIINKVGGACLKWVWFPKSGCGQTMKPPFDNPRSVTASGRLAMYLLSIFAPLPSESATFTSAGAIWPVTGLYR